MFASPRGTASRILDSVDDALGLTGGESQDRLAEPRRFVEAGAVSVLSLDVFDTTLWRTVPRPTDAFLLLGSEIAEQGLLASRIDPYAFRRLRIAAEARARQTAAARVNRAEVTLDDIWSQFPERLFQDGAIASMPERELELERRITIPDLDIAELAKSALEQGCRLAFVSNTYFNRQQLARLLSRPELDLVQEAKVFPSSAYGMGKGDAAFWRTVLHEMDVPPERMLHVGDELVSDVNTPSQLGIRTHHYPRLNKYLSRVLTRERVAGPEPHSPPVSALNTRSGDLGITGLRTKVATRVNDLELVGDLPVAWQYGAAVLGPVLTGFTQWVHNQAEELKTPTVWCMMREGELLADMINRVASQRRSEIEGRPIWLSRHVTGRATLTKLDEQELRSMVARRMAPTAQRLIRNLGLSEAEVPELQALMSRSLDRSEVVDEVVGVLCTREQLRERILEESSKARRRLVSYLAATTGDMDTLTLVDLGWGGTIQSQLSRALQASGIHTHLIGLYMAMNDGAYWRVLEGCEMHSYLTSLGSPEGVTAQISRSPEVIEQVCLATTGSLLDFDDDGRPIRDTAVPTPQQVICKLVTQHGVRAFQNEWLRYADSIPTWPRLDGAEVQYLLEVLRASVSEPTADEARVFGAWEHEDNFGTDHGDHVIPEHLAPFVPYLSPLHLLEMSTKDVYWPMGLAARYDSGLSSASSALLSGRVSPDVFEPGRNAISARLHVHPASSDEAFEEQPVRVNRNGLSYVHFRVDQPNIAELRFFPTDQPSVFRIDWIDLALKIEGNRAVQRIHLEGEAQLAGLIYSGCRWLYDGVAMGFGRDPHVIIQLDGLAAGQVYGVEMQVAFGVMPIRVPLRPVPISPDKSAKVTWVASRVRAEAKHGGVKAVIRGAYRLARRALKITGR